MAKAIVPSALSPAAAVVGWAELLGAWAEGLRRGEGWLRRGEGLVQIPFTSPPPPERLVPPLDSLVARARLGPRRHPRRVVFELDRRRSKTMVVRIPTNIGSLN